LFPRLGNDGWPVRSRAVRSWGRDNNWGRSVGLDGGRGISRGRSISWGWGIDGLTGVLDIGDVTSVGIRGVGHSLDAAIGKSNVVFSLGGIAVAGLRGSKVGTAVSVIDTIGVVICRGDIRVDGGRSISRNWGRSVGRNWGRSVGRNWGRSVGWGRDGDSVLRSSSGSSHKSQKSNEALEKMKLF
jgi:hypothetical protein